MAGLLANIYQYAKASAFKQLAQPKFKDNKATSSPEFRPFGSAVRIPGDSGYPTLTLQNKKQTSDIMSLA